jgi:hypothetical protein
VASGASHAPRILAARRISFRRPPAWLFKPVQGCLTDAIGGWSLRVSQTECGSSQCQYGAKPRTIPWALTTCQGTRQAKCISSTSKCALVTGAAPRSTMNNTASFGKLTMRADIHLLVLDLRTSAGLSTVGARTGITGITGYRDWTVRDSVRSWGPITRQPRFQFAGNRWLDARTTMRGVISSLLGL